MAQLETKDKIMNNNIRYNLLKELTNEQTYIDFLKDKEGKTSTPLIEQMEKLVEIECHKDRLVFWERICSVLVDKGSLNKLANPYYIGYGNPESEVLILGQEKAFNAKSNSNLLFHESINNLFQWRWIIKEELKPNEESSLTFDPRFPKAYFNKEFKKSHTWYKYSMLVAKIIGEENYENLMNSEASLASSLFHHCFISEINFIPSKSNKQVKLLDVRQKMLSHGFYKKFKYVFVAAGNLLGEKEEEIIKNIFEADKITPPNGKLLGNYGKGKERRVNIYKSPNQIICTCNQLSGSAGWKNDHIKSMGVLIKNWSA